MKLIVFCGNQLFHRVQKEKPHLFKKIIPVFGDITKDGLGITNDMKKKLCDEVSIFFHGAATLKLESNLKDAMEMNAWGTWRVLQLAKQMKNLEVSLFIYLFIFITTHFSTLPLRLIWFIFFLITYVI